MPEERKKKNQGTSQVLRDLVVSSLDLFCLTNGPKFKDVQPTMMKVKEKQQILAFDKLDPASV